MAAPHELHGSMHARMGHDGHILVTISKRDDGTLAITSAVPGQHLVITATNDMGVCIIQAQRDIDVELPDPILGDPINTAPADELLPHTETIATAETRRLRHVDASIAAAVGEDATTITTRRGARRVIASALYPREIPPDRIPVADETLRQW